MEQLFISLLYESLEQSLFFLPLALGIYISYGILKTTDMTTEGSFVMGAGVFARLMALEFNPIIGICLSILSGAVAGIGVSIIQAKNRINPLIAGIIGLFMLYTLNFEMMGRPNISLQHIYINKSWSFSLIFLCLAVLIAILSSHLGLMLRAFGNNSELLRTLGKCVEGYRMLGLALSNSLAAFSGIITACLIGYADLNMGFGMTLTGIGTVVIGKEIVKRVLPRLAYSGAIEMMAVFLGVYLYFLAVNGLLSFNINPIYLKFFLGLALIFLLRGKQNEKHA